MSRHLIARIVSAFATSTLVLGAMAMPVAAGQVTRLVDDNGVQCPGAGYTSIQAAINASVAGDKVYVCPGHYAEQINLNKQIVVKATPLFAAHIDVPGTLAPLGAVVAAVNITADNASFKGFKMHFVAGGVVPVVRPSVLSCAHADAAINVLGLNDRVSYNRMDVSGPSTLNGACGYDYGIVVGQHPVTSGVRPSGEALSSATARVTFNKIRDFKVGGILVEDEDSYAYLRRNAIQYLHLQESGCVIDVVIPCGPVAATNTGINGVFNGAFGIGVESGAEADIIRNAVKSGPNATSFVPTVAVGTPMLNVGVWLQDLDPSESNTVFHNAIWRVQTGVFTAGGAASAEISYNHVTFSNVALKAATSGDEWHHNNVHDNLIGILANVGENDFHDNVAEDNGQYDCYDSTTGTGTANTDNTWVNNIGALANPDGICDPAGP